MFAVLLIRLQTRLVPHELVCRGRKAAFFHLEQQQRAVARQRMDNNWRETRVCCSEGLEQVLQSSVTLFPRTKSTLGSLNSWSACCGKSGLVFLAFTRVVIFF